MNAIEVRGLTKDYGGRRGLFDLDLTVEAGEVFGFLGPNGAGKSTTIRLLMDMVRPTRGTARILGLDVRADSTAVKRLVGYLPGELPDFGGLRGGEVVGYMAGLRRMSVDGRVTELCRRLELDLSIPFRTLSRGNKQKVGLVIALMHRPPVLILDEPTAGLDPLLQQEFHALVREAQGSGATVFLSSHILSEVEQVCSRAAVLRDGRLVRVLQLQDLRGLGIRRVDATFSGQPPVALLEALPGVERVEVIDTVARCTVRGPTGGFVEGLAGTGVVDVATSEPSLEETFLELYRAAQESPS
jgi:ABC-2 type transport system ATP-binding protein